MNSDSHETVPKNQRQTGEIKILTLKRAMASDVQARLKSSVVGVTIGNFDGMHLGHQGLFAALDQELKEKSRRLSLPSLKIMLTFAPHPRIVIGRIKQSKNNENQLVQITSVRDKAALADGYGFDYFFLRRFIPSFAAISPTDFIEQYLSKTLHAKIVVVGYDWSFGRNRAGTPDLLVQEAAGRGIEVNVVPPVVLDGQRVSSTLVRESLVAGNLPLLQKLLNRDFAFSGLVVPGNKRGRQLGFPTANLQVGNQLLPPNGVYAVYAGSQGRLEPAVCNIGVRPTFGGGQTTVEVHLLNGRDHQLYGSRLVVEFVQLLREERRFNNVDELKAQIVCDIADARTRFVS